MATVQDTTLTPGKLEALADWLPAQPWYRDPGGAAALQRCGGFRLDDPAGEVGIEFIVVVETAGTEPTAYLVPMTYRGAPLPDAPADALITTSEHGILGTRWFYDATKDPVALAELAALLRGEAIAQHQYESDTLDPTVTVVPVPHATAANVRITRILTPDTTGPLTAGWTQPDGTPARAAFAAVAHG
ncbi:1,4-alpha-glucan branching protein [Kitasatospora sp. NPDC006697]|uniref:maltokinase N-terminal cap-like domain-containing protein n=1 Tax=Kitasatospora sp. NPDC006697 TaxID=3364020 RepID=UPI0036B77279